MMKTLYLDLFSGISGDMFIAALIDLGVDAPELRRELTKLKLEGYHLHVTREQRRGIAGVRFDVHLEDQEHGEDTSGVHAHPHEHGHPHSHSHSHHQDEVQEHSLDHSHGAAHSHDTGDASHEAHTHPHVHGRSFSEIRKLMSATALSDWVKERAISIFEKIAVAEGRIHGLQPEEVAFHEVGAVDSIVDIVGACIGLEMLEKPRVLASPVVEGTGWINCAHGRFPVPAPATLAILGVRGIALSQCDEPHELVTPTGAALLAEFVEHFGPMRNLVAEKIGFGLGARETKTRPNALRVILGEASTAPEGHDWETDRVVVLETNLDDLSGEIVGHVLESAMAAGALDVFHSPIQMKKNRPGVLLTILCAEADAGRFSELLLRETSALGVRMRTAERRKLHRKFVQVRTSFGEVTMKLGLLDGKVVQVAPEYESCRKVSENSKVPLKEVYRAAIGSLAPTS